jgi:putative membrane protein
MFRYSVWMIPLALACSRTDATTARRLAADSATAKRQVAGDTATRADPAAPALDDAAILGAVDQANGAEIAAANMAMTQTTNGVVRAMAKRIQDDHSRSREQVKALAAKLSIRLAPPNGDEGALSALRGKRGAEFDRAFVEHEITMHQQVIEKVNSNLLPSASNAEVKSLLQATLPVLQSHLDLARAAQDQLKTS